MGLWERIRGGKARRPAGASRWGRGIWRTEVLVRVRELRRRLEVARELERELWPQGQSARTREVIAVAVEEDLTAAKKATEEAQRPLEKLSAWWTGSATTTGWESVHEAELNLVSIESEEDVRAGLPQLQSWLEIAMDASERRSRYERALKAQAKGKAPLDRTRVRQVLKDVTVANNERYANLRAFRNNLVLVTGVLASLIGALAIGHLIDPDFLTLCSSGGEETSCLDGSTASRADVLLVALVGAVGGMLAIAFGLSETTVAPSRFDPRAWQALLKPVAGAATALGGVLLIQGDILLGPSDNRSESLLLAYALLFGFSQQLFTRFVDKRAGGLIGVEESEGVVEEEEGEEEGEGRVGEGNGDGGEGSVDEGEEENGNGGDDGSVTPPEEPEPKKARRKKKTAPESGPESELEPEEPPSDKGAED